MRSLALVGVVLAFLVAGQANAGIILFDLTGKADSGLTGANEVGATTSPGSGGEIGAGISFDDVTNVMTINVGWGSGNGFTDLSGDATAGHIHGPTPDPLPLSLDGERERQVPLELAGRLERECHERWFLGHAEHPGCRRPRPGSGPILPQLPHGDQSRRRDPRSASAGPRALDARSGGQYRRWLGRLALSPPAPGGLTGCFFVLLQDPRVATMRNTTKTLVLALLLCVPDAAIAEMIWTGPSTTFTKPAGADWTLAQNQDRLTDSVWITRGNIQGIFNIKQEPGYSHQSSPADTEWAYGAAANWQSLTFTDWEEWANKRRWTRSAGMRSCIWCRIRSTSTSSS